MMHEAGAVNRFLAQISEICYGKLYNAVNITASRGLVISVSSMTLQMHFTE